MDDVMKAADILSFLPIDGRCSWADLSAAGKGCSSGSLFLHRRARHRTVGTEDAAVALLRPEQAPAALALIEELACPRGHRFERLMAATGTCEDRGELRHDVRLRARREGSI